MEWILINGAGMWSHLKDVNETYFEHMRFAQRCGFRMILAGLACVLHSIMPNIFVKTASDTMKALGQEITERKLKGQP
jgi:hypothetical protein